MPLKVELNAVKKNFMKLMKLPVKDLLPALKMVIVYECFLYKSLLRQFDTETDILHNVSSIIMWMSSSKVILA